MHGETGKIDGWQFKVGREAYEESVREAVGNRPELCFSGTHEKRKQTHEEWAKCLRKDEKEQAQGLTDA